MENYTWLRIIRKLPERAVNSFRRWRIHKKLERIKYSYLLYSESIVFDADFIKNIREAREIIQKDIKLLEE